MTPPHNPNPGHMAETAEQSAHVKQYLRAEITAEERRRVEAEYPLEADEVFAEDNPGFTGVFAVRCDDCPHEDA